VRSSARWPGQDFTDGELQLQYNSGMDSDEEIFEKGCLHFDSQDYFEAHELWEELWNEAVGARHAFLQCLIQTAVALHHASRQNWAGTRKLLASSLGYWEKGKSESGTVDMLALKDAVLEFELALQRKLGDEPDLVLPFFKLPRVSSEGLT
jgi:Domain of unknown function (DUF309)